MYAKLVDNIFQYAPKNYKTKDKNLIINFNQDKEFMKEYGYKEVIDIKPNYNTKTQYIKVSSYTETENNITINYEVLEQNKKDPITTLENRVTLLEDYDIDIIATTFDIDFRLCEIEWVLEDLGITEIEAVSVFKGGIKTMALSRYELAKTMILGGKYNKETLTRQLVAYLSRGYISQDEHNELISLMEARELVENI